MFQFIESCVLINSKLYELIGVILQEIKNSR